MKITREDNYLGSETFIRFKIGAQNWQLGFVVHPASLTKGTEILGFKPDTPSMLPIVRTSAHYYRLHPESEVEILFEPEGRHMEFKTKAKKSEIFDPGTAKVQYGLCSNCPSVGTCAGTMICQEKGAGLRNPDDNQK